MKKSGLMTVFQTQYPGPVAVVVSMDQATQRPNVAAQNWFMFTSYLPPQLAISVGAAHATEQAIRTSGEFVLALPSCRQVEAVQFCGTKSGADHDKFKNSGFQPMPARKVKPPRIAGACANFECRVTTFLQTGDHTLFVGEIVASDVSADARDRLFVMNDGQFAGYETIAAQAPGGAARRAAR